MGKGKRGKERSPPRLPLPLSLIFVKYAAARRARCGGVFLRDEEREKRRAARWRRVLLSPMTPTLLRPAPPPVGWVYFGRGGF